MANGWRGGRDRPLIFDVSRREFLLPEKPAKYREEMAAKKEFKEMEEGFKRVFREAIDEMRKGGL